MENRDNISSRDWEQTPKTVKILINQLKEENRLLKNKLLDSESRSSPISIKIPSSFEEKIGVFALLMFILGIISCVVFLLVK